MMAKTSKKKKVLALNNTQIDESSLFIHVSKIIEKRKNRTGMYANREVTLMYWEIGRFIGSVLLGGECAEYGRKIVATLSQQLVKKYGQAFDIHNIRRMVRFAEKFSNSRIVTELASQLSWSHFKAMSDEIYKTTQKCLFRRGISSHVDLT